MRTNIEIDDRLMRDALRVSGGKTKRAVVEATLRLLVQTKAQAGIRPFYADKSIGPATLR